MGGTEFLVSKTPPASKPVGFSFPLINFMQRPGRKPVDLLAILCLSNCVRRSKKDGSREAELRIMSFGVELGKNSWEGICLHSEQPKGTS